MESPSGLLSLQFWSSATASTAVQRQLATGWWQSLLAAAAAAGSIAAFLAVSAAQPRPYMDEILHIPMAQKYCAAALNAGNSREFILQRLMHVGWNEWDPMITTPPGPYLFPAVAAAGFSWIGNGLEWLAGAGPTGLSSMLRSLSEAVLTVDACSTTALRFWSLGWLLASVELLCWMLGRSQTGHAASTTSTTATTSSSSVAALPPAPLGSLKRRTRAGRTPSRPAAAPSTSATEPTVPRLQSSPHTASASAVVLPLVVVTFSPLLMSSMLFYTDSGSLFWTLAVHAALGVMFRAPGPQVPSAAGSGASTDLASASNVAYSVSSLPSLSRTVLAALCGAVAILFRQTNVVWLLHACLQATLPAIIDIVDQLLDWAVAHCGPAAPATKPVEGDMEPQTPASGSAATPSQRRTAPEQPGPRTIVGVINPLVRRFSPVLAVVFAFGCFVIVHNGGSIVLGDRSAHQPVFHFAQLCYLMLVVGFYPFAELCWNFVASAVVAGPSRPGVPRSSRLRTQLQHQLQRISTTVWKKRGSVAAAIAETSYRLYVCSLAHPYLLADNRHWTFLLWNRLFGRIGAVGRATLAPVYLACGWLVLTRMIPTGPAASLPSPATPVGTHGQVALCRALVWLLCSALTVIPAHLLEFRYFIVPTAVALLMMYANNDARTVMQGDNSSPTGDQASNSVEPSSGTGAATSGMRKRRSPSISSSSAAAAPAARSSRSSRQRSSSSSRSTASGAVSSASGQLVGSESESVARTGTGTGTDIVTNSASGVGTGNGSSVVVLVVFLVLNTLVNTAVISVFVRYPWVWTDGSVARRMW